MTEFDRSYIPRVRDLSWAGLNDSEISRLLGISVSTLRAWAERYPEFAMAWEDGRLQADTKVIGALFKRACGYEKTKWKETKDGTMMEQVHYPPDVKACIFWLTNRRPEQWVDKVEHDLGSAGKVIGDNISEMEAARRIAYALSKAINDSTEDANHGRSVVPKTE